MIERIVGKLLEKSPTFCVVDCGGIGIGVYISVNTYQQISDTMDSVCFLTHLHVREDLIQLFGFHEESERTLFRRLINIGGIGPKLAVTILSGISVNDFIDAIANEDYQMLTQISGIGKKTAQRIILELKEKIDISGEVDASTPRSISGSPERKKIDEAILALTTLGYKSNEARATIQKIMNKNSGELSLEQIIKLALKEF
jgi:Holliday junction DNA helicase RuvA